MARSVYYDPFGMRMAGEQAGMRDEAFMQDQTRRARQSDYDFNIVQPIQLEGLQRDNAYANYRDPYMRRGLGLAEDSMKGANYDAEYGRRENYTRATGDQNLIRQLDAERYPVDYTAPGGQQEVKNPLVQAYDDWQALLAQEGITDPTSPQADAWRMQMEQMYGLQPNGLQDTGALHEALAAEPKFNQLPQVNYRRNPATGQMEAIANNPMGYYDRAMQPEYYKNAQFQLQGAGVQARNNYSSGMVEQARINAGGAAGAATGDTFGAE